AVMNSPLHGREWNSHKRSDAIEWHLVEKAESQRHRVVSGKTGQRLYRRFVTFLIRDRPRQGFDLFQQRFVEGHALLRVRCFTLAKSQRSMTRNGRQPCTKLTRLFDTGQCLESEQERVL